jgi:hypothetical protein
MMLRTPLLVALVAFTSLLACSNGTEVFEAGDAQAKPAVSAPVPDSAGDSETPATGRAELIASWIARNDYRRWTCEPVGHDARSPSPHGRNRICNNQKVVDHGPGEYPTGAASVKEIFDDLGKLTGHLVTHKLGPGKAESWLWYMEVGGTIVLNGRGDTPEPSAKCVGCHAQAGSDAEHSGHDYVYTQLKK